MTKVGCDSRSATKSTSRDPCWVEPGVKRSPRNSIDLNSRATWRDLIPQRAASAFHTHTWCHRAL
eukprot:684071-Alexandrium_andersonii.AAC.1